MTEKMIIDAYCRIRAIDQTIPDNILDFMKHAALEKLRKDPVMVMLPSVHDAGVIAVNVASNVRPKLTAQKEAFFIAGFQECVKYLFQQERMANR